MGAKRTVVTCLATSVALAGLDAACGGASEPAVGDAADSAADAGIDASTLPDWATLCLSRSALVEDGWTDPYYVVRNIRIQGAPSGEYRFFGVHPEPPLQIVTLHLAHDCTEVATLDYFWADTIRSEGEGPGHEFAFAGFFAFDVYKRGGGSINLYHLPESLFDGTHVVVVP